MSALLALQRRTSVTSCRLQCFAYPADSLPALSPLTPLPFLFQDERLSTAAVTRTLIEQDASRAKRAEIVDKMAAAYILQGALDRLTYLARDQA